MKLNKFLVLSAAFLIYASSFAATVSDSPKLPPELLANLPPGETVEPLPEAILQDPPVYFDVDSKGNVWTQRLVVDKFGNYQLTDELVSQSRLDELTSQRDVVLRNMENISLPGQGAGQGSSQASTSSCPLPWAFSITGVSNQTPSGPIKVADTYRPTGATTQWVVYDFYTTNYRGAGSHMPTALFHDDVVYGWGAFIGDNHLHTQGLHCGSNALFNSQIEGFLLVDQSDVPAKWQTAIFNDPTYSCGQEMYDGPVIFDWLPNPRYRFEMQASTGHWVAYRIMEFKINPLRWDVLTDWKVIDVDGSNWIQWWTEPPPNWSLHSFTQGIWFGATPALPGASPWSINIFNTQCGWF